MRPRRDERRGLDDDAAARAQQLRERRVDRADEQRLVAAVERLEPPRKRVAAHGAAPDDPQTDAAESHLLTHVEAAGKRERLARVLPAAAREAPGGDADVAVGP